MGIESLRHHYLRRIVVPAMRTLGFRAASGIARSLARGIVQMNPPGRARALQRLTAMYEGGEQQADVPHILASSYEHLATFWAEALFIPRRLRPSTWRRHVRVENEGTLLDLAASGRGCLLATAYHGNIAVAACALGQLFRPVHVIVDTFAQPQLAAWQRELFAQPQVIPVDRRQAARVIPGVLEAGGAVMMICEHDRHRGRGVETRFLGQTLNCYPTLGRLALWYDVPIAVVTCTRQSPPFCFSLELHDTIEADFETRDETVVRRVLGSLERAILLTPEQYLWSVQTGAEAPHHQDFARSASSTTRSGSPPAASVANSRI